MNFSCSKTIVIKKSFGTTTALTINSKLIPIKHEIPLKTAAVPADKFTILKLSKIFKHHTVLPESYCAFVHGTHESNARFFSAIFLPFIFT